jgi:3-phosphoshikimate 1-carboxyvinyltransferase
VVELDPAGWNGQMEPFDVDLPGDPSAAAFLTVAAQLVPGSNVTVRAVCTNPTRTGLFEIARDMGAGIEVRPLGERGGEPVADVLSWYAGARGMKIGGELVPRAIDEIPILCALAARATGTTTIVDAEELRVKESDRIATMAEVLRAFGVRCEELPDGLEIEGTDAPLKACRVDSRGDHRIAMTAAVLGLLADGVTTIDDVACIGTSFPRFVGTLRALGAELEVEPT